MNGLVRKTFRNSQRYLRASYRREDVADCSAASQHRHGMEGYRGGKREEARSTDKGGTTVMARPIILDTGL